MNSLMSYAIRRRMQSDLCIFKWDFDENNSNRDTWDRYSAVKYLYHHIIFKDNLIKTEMSLSK
jgi:hypothetical protein